MCYPYFGTFLPMCYPYFGTFLPMCYFYSFSVDSEVSSYPYSGVVAVVMMVKAAWKQREY
jgi:hypothetical protein